MLGRVKKSKLVPLNIVYQGMSMMSLNKTSGCNSRLKQGEMCKSMKYEKLFKDDQKFLEGPYYRKHLNKIWNEETKIQLPFLAMTICNNFLLIQALAILIFILERRKSFWSLLLKPTTSTMRQHQKESVNFRHKFCYVVADSRDLNEKYFCFK